MTIRAAWPGEAVVTVEDAYNVRRRWTLQVPAGETALTWDGLGYNQEPLAAGTYEVKVLLKAEDGRTACGETKIRMRGCRNVLVFAFPREETFYPGENSSWLVQLRLPQPGGQVMAEFYCEEMPETPVDVIKQRFSASGVVSFTWKGKLNGNRKWVWYRQNPYKVRSAIRSNYHRCSSS